jgi:hypothetical protein
MPLNENGVRITALDERYYYNYFYQMLDAQDKPRQVLLPKLEKGVWALFKNSLLTALNGNEFSRRELKCVDVELEMLSTDITRLSLAVTYAAACDAIWKA